MKRDLPSLVVFSGRDAAGKSTNCRMLEQYLRRSGVRVKRTFINTPHTFAYLLVTFLRERGYRVLPANSKFYRTLWAFIETMCILPVLFFKVYVPIWLGYVVLTEKYIADAIVTIGLRIRDDQFMESWYSWFLLHFIHPKSVMIYLYSRAETLTERRLKRKSVDDQSLKNPEILKCAGRNTQLYLERYEEIYRYVKAYPLETSSKSIEGTFEMVLGQLTGVKKVTEA